MVSGENNLSEQNLQKALRAAVEAAKAGRREEAHRLLRGIVAADPLNEVAWLWLAGVTDQPNEAQAALDRVAQLNPYHPRLEDARRWAKKGAHRGSDESSDSTLAFPAEQGKAVKPGAKPSPATRLSPSTCPRRLLLGLGGLAALALICGLAWVIWIQVDAAQARLATPPTPDNLERTLALQPELNVAVSESRWEDAIAVLQVMRAFEPDNPTLAKELSRVYYQLGLQHRDQGDLEGALIALDEALALDPHDLSAQEERRLMMSYHQGISYHQDGDWERAVENFSAIYREYPYYLDVAELLYSTYYNLGLSQQASDDLIGAQASYRAASELLPDEQLAREKADEVALLLRPPTATPAPSPTPDPATQRIVVDISEQRMYVYEGDDLRWEWVVSTGEQESATAIGQFKVQSKIPKAYASTWNLDMPHWLGIYWSGPLENGIHAVPTQRHTGIRLWDGFLGQRVSYGCVILSEENAETLYDWANIGTPVTIQP